MQKWLSMGSIIERIKAIRERDGIIVLKSMYMKEEILYQENKKKTVSEEYIERYWFDLKDNTKI